MATPKPQRKYAIHPQTCKLTQEQAREIRLSYASAAALAKQHQVSPTTVQAIRAGRQYGALLPDEEEARRRRASGSKVPPFNLADYRLIVGDPRHRAYDEDVMEATDATHECQHGRLPHDRTPACGCWPREKQDQPLPQEDLCVSIVDTHRERVERFANQAGDKHRPVEDRPAIPAGVV